MHDSKKKDSNKKKGKMAALCDLRDTASQMMGDDMGELQMAKNVKVIKKAKDPKKDKA